MIRRILDSIAIILFVAALPLVAVAQSGVSAISASPGAKPGPGTKTTCTVAGGVWRTSDPAATLECGTGLTYTSSILALSGGYVVAPSIRHSGAATGMVLASGNLQFFVTASNYPLYVHATGVTTGAGQAFSWTSSADDATATKDTFLIREAAAIVQAGLDVNGAAVNQTLKAHDGITGTNISGANLTIAAGRGTGTGAGGTLVFQTAPIEASGTTAQTLATRMTIQKDGGITLAGVVFANLGTPADGTLFYCSDCTIASPCADSGTGALAKRLNGTWVCN